MRGLVVFFFFFGKRVYSCQEYRALLSNDSCVIFGLVQHTPMGVINDHLSLLVNDVTTKNPFRVQVHP